jgi:hypothetical protein
LREADERRGGMTREDFGQALQNVLGKTALFGWGDLKNLVESRTKIEAGMSLEDFARALAHGTDKVESAVSLSAYRSRFGAGGPDPFEEFFLLLYLVAEVEGKLQDSDVAVLQHVLKFVPRKQRTSYEYLKAVKHEGAQKALKEYLKNLVEPALTKWSGGETDDDERHKRSKQLLDTLADIAAEREKAKSDAGGGDPQP